MISHSISTSEPPTIKRVHFHILSAEEIRSMSVVEITETSTFNRGLPAPGGVQDARLGTVDRRILCATCNMDSVNCQGHCGHITLPFPMYHSTFFETVLKTLRCVCYMCSRLCVTKEDRVAFDGGMFDGQNPKNQYSAVYAAVRTRRRCPHCGSRRPNFVRSGMSIRVEWPDDMEWESNEERAYCTEPFTQRDALSILRNMTDDDCRILGLDPIDSHPRNMISTVLLVPPPAMRPTIAASQGSKTRANDDLTHKLQDICKRSNDVRNALKGQPWRTCDVTADVADRIARLQYEVFTIVNSNVRGHKPSMQRSGVPTKSYIGRLKGKDGRIRGNLMGKRVDHCSRCVISPGPRIDIDQVGIPRKIALGLTVPETVTAGNLRDLTERVRRGAGRLDGAESVISSDGVVIHLAQCKARQRICLVEGWIVERYLRNDDVVAFNRQPSLHKLGLMGHRVLLVDDMTFRLNLSVTAPYNADFDGDEMNVHVPQQQTSRASVRMLMMVSQQIISPQNKPCMGLVQDSLLGAFRMTRMEELLTRTEASHIFGHLKHTSRDILPAPCVTVRGVHYWSGKQMASMLLQSVVHIDRDPGVRIDGNARHGALDPWTKLVIRNGRILSGPLNKAALGATAGGIVDTICRSNGNESAARFLSDAQRMALAYNELRGFSVSISDCVMDRGGSDRVRERIATAMKLADDVTTEATRLRTTTGEADLAESTIRSILGKALMQSGSIVETHLDAAPSPNAIRTMVECGSKGSVINLSQIHACVGQQSVEGKRITAENGGRSLPCFHADDRSLESRGFVKHSYVQGLSPHEFFYHAMGGREGIVDTAVKTAASGYIQRRQVKAMESHRVEYDETVRNSSGGIVQFRYHGASFEPCRLERILVPVLHMSVKDVYERHETSEDAERVLRARDALLRTMQTLGVQAEERITLPFDPDRMKRTLTSTAVATASRARRQRSRSVTSHTQAASERAADEFVEFAEACTDAAVRMTLHDALPRSFLVLHDPGDVTALIAHIKRVLVRAKIEPGTMIGCIAAQSIGEPTTQMSLRGDEMVVVRTLDGVAVRTIRDVVETHLVHRTAPSDDLQVVGVTPRGRVHWARVLGVSSHPANGIMVRITTVSGRTVVGTASHSYLVRDAETGNIAPMRGDELQKGDMFPVAIRMPSWDYAMRNAGRTCCSRGATMNGDDRLAQHLLSSEWFVPFVFEDRHRSESLLLGILDCGCVDHTTGCIRVSVDARHASVVHAVSLHLGVSPIRASEGEDWYYRYSDVHSTYEQVWWDPVQTVENLGVSDETVYDFTVEQGLQSFMLANGIFVHNTLNTFHSAGIASKNVTLGIPRLQELLTVSRNMRTPCCTLHFHEFLCRDENDRAQRYLADTIPLTTLGDIVESYEILNEPVWDQTAVQDDEDMVRVAATLEPCEARGEHPSKYIVRIVLRQRVMITRRITPSDVRRMLRARLGTRAHVVSSEVNDLCWVVRIRFMHVANMVRDINVSEERQAVLCHRILGVLLKKVVVCGHASITSATCRQEAVHVICARDDGHAEFVHRNDHVVDVVGPSLCDLVAIPMVDWTRCYSNNVVDVQNTLGIAAASEVLYAELREVISFDGTYVFPGHLSLIVDTMCREGYIKPLNRFGVNREHSNALARSSYEETPDILTEAAIFAEKTFATGVSTSIILGQPASIGTGIVRSRMHQSMLPHSMIPDAKSSYDDVVMTTVGHANAPAIAHTFEYVERDTQFSAGYVGEGNPQCARSSMTPFCDASEECFPQQQHADSTSVFIPDECQRPYDDRPEGPTPVPSEQFATVPAADAPFRLHSPENSDGEDEEE